MRRVLGMLFDRVPLSSAVLAIATAPLNFLLEFPLRRIGVSGVMSGVVLLGLFPFAWIGLGYGLWRSADEDSRAPRAGRAGR